MKSVSMKRYLFIAFSGIVLWVFTGCKPDDHNQPEEPKVQDTVRVPSAFVKTHLLEEFTGQDCGYCPYGMDCVHDFVKDNPNWIMVLHHYGYQRDHFTVNGSQKITNNLKVNGAPTITVNRSTTRTSGGISVCFHPGYLPEVNRSQFDDSTYVGLNLTTTYDASTRNLIVDVNGMVVKQDHPELKLTLLIKESGMIDYQSDYYKTYEGWEEFCHVNAVRAFLTNPLGDEIVLERDTQKCYAPIEPMFFNAQYEFTMSENWLPENSSVVAIVSEDVKPVVQAAQQPIVGQGGADIVHGGIKAVPVADYYPEPGADIGPHALTGQDEIVISNAQGFYTPYAAFGFMHWQIQAYNTYTTYNVNQTACVPFLMLDLFTDINATTIPAGTYEINGTLQPGTVNAGYRDDENVEIAGSTFYLTSLSYFNQGYLVPAAQWLIVDGTLQINKQGWSLNGHALNGTEINLVSSTPIVNGGPANAPRRLQQGEHRSLQDLHQLPRGIR